MKIFTIAAALVLAAGCSSPAPIVPMFEASYHDPLCDSSIADTPPGISDRSRSAPRPLVTWCGNGPPVCLLQEGCRR